MIETCFSASETTIPALTIVDCLAVGQMVEQGKDERVILFIKLMEGETLSTELEKGIKTQIRLRRSARHVPARVRTFEPPKHCWLDEISTDHANNRHSVHVERKTCRGAGQEGKAPLIP